MSKNKIEDLRDHLFAQLERLGDESIKDEDMEKEIKRSEAIVSVAREITASAMTEVHFIKATGQNTNTQYFPRPELPGGKNGKALEHKQ